MAILSTGLSLCPQPPFDFAGTAYSHGWVVLLPNSWDNEAAVMTRIEQLNAGLVVKLLLHGEGTVEQPVLHIEVQHGRPLHASDEEEICRRVSRMFRLEEDLTPFYRMCRRRGKRWSKVVQGLGRLLVSPTMFEDMVKTICTTNIQWGGTRRMTASLVGMLGAALPADPRQKAFPSPEAIANAPDALFEEAVRLGYRAPYIRGLAEAVAGGAFDPEDLRDPQRPTAQLKKELLAIKGIGSYAAATLLMVLGRYDDLAVDTVFRDHVRNTYFDGRKVDDATARAVYDEWGEWKYLAFWSDLWKGRNENLEG